MLSLWQHLALVPFLLINFLFFGGEEVADSECSGHCECGPDVYGIIIYAIVWKKVDIKYYQQLDYRSEDVFLCTKVYT